MSKPLDTDSYINSFSPSTQKLLQQVRETIKKAAPNAQEVISYSMPAFKYKGMLVWFAGYAHHIGFYPGASGIAAFKLEFGTYKNAKGSVQFPLDKPLPLDLITRIVQFKVSENEEKEAFKKRKK